jgi:hypothetical protein
MPRNNTVTKSNNLSMQAHIVSVYDATLQVGSLRAPKVVPGQLFDFFAVHVHSGNCAAHDQMIPEVCVKVTRERVTASRFGKGQTNHDQETETENNKQTEGRVPAYSANQVSSALTIGSMMLHLPTVYSFSNKNK